MVRYQEKLICGETKILVMDNTMSRLKGFDDCKNIATHHRNLNDVENGICILGNFNGMHRDFCWCDLQNIDVIKPVTLSCIICLMYEKLSYSRNPVPVENKPTENIEFSDFMDVIFEQELEKIKTARYEINCGLPEKEQLKCREKFDRI